MDIREIAPFLDLLDEWVLVLDDGSISFVNKKALSIMHLELEEVVGREPNTVFPPKIWAPIKMFLSRMDMARGGVLEGKVDLEHQTLGILKATVRAYGDGGTTLIVLDHSPVEPVGEAMRRQVELEDRLSALLSFITGTGIGLVFVERDADGNVRIRSVNEHVLTMLGMREEDVVGRDPCELVHSKERQIAKRHLEQLWAEGVKSQPLTVRMPDAAGEDLRVQMTTVVLSPPSGNVAVCFLQDVTGMYLALEQERKMAQAIERVEETVVLGDEQGRIFYANPAALRNSGYTLEEVMGKPISIFHAPESVGPVAGQALTEFMKTGWWRGDLMACTKDGRRYPVEVIGSLMRDEDGKPEMFVIVSRKIEDRQRYEAELLLAKRHMEHLKDMLEHDFASVLDRAVVLLERCSSGETKAGALKGELESLNREIMAVRETTGRVASVEFDLKSARTLRPVPLIQVFREDLPSFVRRYGTDKLEIDLSFEDEDITVMANELLPELLNRLLKMILTLAPPGKVVVKGGVRKVHAPPISGPQSSTAAQASQGPAFAEIWVHVPGLRLSEEARGTLSRREMPFRLEQMDGEFSYTISTTNLIVFLYGGQAFVDDLDPERPELGVRFVVLLPLAGRPPKPPGPPVPFEELGARRRRGGRGGRRS